jgi:hypothetical protein
MGREREEVKRLDDGDDDESDARCCTVPVAAAAAVGGVRWRLPRPLWALPPFNIYMEKCSALLCGIYPH